MERVDCKDECYCGEQHKKTVVKQYDGKKWITVGNII